jgi:hypothetical protein
MDSRPGEKRLDCTGGANLVPIIKVVGARIIKIDGLFDQPLTQNMLVKLDIRARIAGNSGDVMDHGRPPVVLDR